MSDRLTWRELATLKLGACVAFAEQRFDSTKFGCVEIPAGTVCTIEEQGLNEIWGGIIVRPVDRKLQDTLLHHQSDYDNCIFLDGPNDDALSPFVLDDSCPIECI